MIGLLAPMHSMNLTSFSSPRIDQSPEMKRVSAGSNDTLPLKNGSQRSNQSFGAFSGGTRLLL